MVGWFKFNVEIQRPWIQFFNLRKDGGRLLRWNSSGSQAYGLRERQHGEKLCTMNVSPGLQLHSRRKKKSQRYQSHIRSPTKLCLVLDVTQGAASRQNHGVSPKGAWEALAKDLCSIQWVGGRFKDMGVWFRVGVVRKQKESSDWVSECFFIYSFILEEWS